MKKLAEVIILISLVAILCIMLTEAWEKQMMNYKLFEVRDIWYKLQDIG